MDKDPINTSYWDFSKEKLKNSPCQELLQKLSLAVIKGEDICTDQ